MSGFYRISPDHVAKLVSQLVRLGYVRIIDASGEPHSSANVAKDAFDKEGIGQMKLGKSFYDRVDRQDGKS